MLIIFREQAGNTMKISKIELENVKCFLNETISLLKEGTNEPLSVCAFVGANGAGKSTILKSIVAAFSVVDNDYQGELFTDDAVAFGERHLRVSLDLEINRNEKSIINYDETHIELIYQHITDEEYESLIHEKDNNDEENIEVEKDILYIPSDISDTCFKQYPNAILALLWKEQVGLIMYYDSFRFVSNKNPVGPNLQQIKSSKESALSSNLNKNGENCYRDLDLKQWIVNMDYTRLKEPTRRNKAIYNHMIKAFELLFHPLKFETINQNGNIMFKNEEDGQQLSVDMLSDGFKSIFSIVLDIMRRLALAPDFDNEEFYMKEAVILIDEIDCHIHPKWQRKLVPAFRELFPNCQFIFTTHSPYILDSLQSYEIKKVGERTII